MCGCKNTQNMSKRVSGMNLGGIPLERVAVIAAGGAACQFLNKVAEKVYKPTNDEKKDRTAGIVIGLAKIAGGGYLMATSKNQNVRDFGLGLAGAAGYEILPFVATVGANPYQAGAKVAGIGAARGNETIYLNLAGTGSGMYNRHSVAAANDYRHSVGEANDYGHSVKSLMS